MTTALELNSITFGYSHKLLLNDISLAIETGQIGCLLGPSGCGKSTLLRLIAGFEKPQSGTIKIADLLVASSKHTTPPQDRQVGMLFQDLALFPHLTVADNIAYGLHGTQASIREQRIKELLELCRLSGFENRYPHQISGGQRQRVALARAMAPKPRLILLDEPFSSVESGLQTELIQEVKTMLKANQSTALWVTHSLDEAFAVADQMGVVLGGQLLQWDKPQTLFDQPASPAVIQFLKNAFMITAQCISAGQVTTSLGQFSLTNPQSFKSGESLLLAIPKKHLRLVSNQKPNARIETAVYQGGHFRLTATINQQDLIQWHHPEPLNPGAEVTLAVDPQNSFKGFKSTF